MEFETRAIHAGQEPDPLTGAVNVPVYQTSTYRQEAIGKHKGYEYSRTGNPTRTALDIALASLEEGKYALSFASGVAATTAVFCLLNQGDRVITGSDVYGGTYRLLEKIFRKYGVNSSIAKGEGIDSFIELLDKDTKLIWIETPTNPLLKIIDIKELAKAAHERNVLLAVDNTFASPYFQRPLTLGADIVVHSTTKYISGHSDVIGGAVITSDTKLYEEIKYYQNATGAVPGPWDAWLTLRGLKTLAVRMKVHEENAQYIAEYLSNHPKVERVIYPGLKDNEYHKLAKKQMTGFSAMISIELMGDYAATEKFLAGLKLFALGESLGGVESLVSVPPRMTHGSISREERLRRGIKDNLIRLSVGIENKEDLRKDLENALTGV